MLPGEKPAYIPKRPVIRYTPSRFGNGAWLLCSGNPPSREARSRAASRGAALAAGGRIPGPAGNPALRLNPARRPIAASGVAFTRLLFQALPDTGCGCRSAAYPATCHRDVPCPGVPLRSTTAIAGYVTPAAVHPAGGRAPASGTTARNPG